MMRRIGKKCEMKLVPNLKLACTPKSNQQAIYVSNSFSLAKSALTMIKPLDGIILIIENVLINERTGLLAPPSLQHEFRLKL